MESTNSLQGSLKNVSEELSRQGIDLQKTSAYLQAILKNSNDMIFLTDGGGILSSFSKGGEKLLGYTCEEVAGSLIKDLASDPPVFEKLMAASRDKESPVRMEVPFRHKYGRTIYFVVSMINLTDTKGQNVGTVGICQDITLRRKLQEELVQIDRLAEIGRTTSSIAHEINNPLAVISEISGWTRVVVSDAEGLRQEDKEELETAVKRIEEQTRRCQSITRQILGFARYSEPTKTSFDIHELLKETITFLQAELKQEHIKVVLNFKEGQLSIRSDPKMLEQVFVNLITNAIHAIKEKGSKKGRIELKTTKAGVNAEIMISDDGMGISQEDREKVFSLFYTTKPPGKGTGLGLPICQNIVNNLGGDMTFESQVGKGTTFTVRIPV